MRDHELDLLEEGFLTRLKQPPPDLTGAALPTYISNTFTHMSSFESTELFQAWQLSQQKLFHTWHQDMQAQQKSWASRLPEHVKVVSTRVQMPLIRRMMARAQHSMQTRHFMEGFSTGFRYVGKIPLTGLYPLVPEGKELGKFERIPFTHLHRAAPLTRHNRFVPPSERNLGDPDVKALLFSTTQLRLPDNQAQIIYDVTQKEL